VSPGSWQQLLISNSRINPFLQLRQQYSNVYLIVVTIVSTTSAATKLCETNRFDDTLQHYPKSLAVMAEKKDLGKFPDINDKLNAPKKVSTFEKQRQEAESKRLREEAETRKALRDFQDAFEDDDEDDPISQLARGYSSSAGRNAAGTQTALGDPRHFTQDRPRNAGPGSLGPPPNLKRKFDQDDDRGRMRSDRYDNPSRRGIPATSQRGIGTGLGLDDEDDEYMNRTRSSDPSVRKPTMLLQSLPSAMTKDDLSKILPASLRVDGIEFLKQSRGEQQRTLSAIVTATADTPISEIDAIVVSLQGRYLGFGCYMKISRHLSTSGGAASGLGSFVTFNDTQPFGAKQAINHPIIDQLKFAPPPNSYNQQPPPGNYQQVQAQQQGAVQVSVTPPTDVKQLKLINSTVESLMTYGADFEALLMARPEVQQDEKWAWLFDSTSQGGVYYRWLVYRQCSEGTQVTPNQITRLFDYGPVWSAPMEKPRFDHVTDFEDLADDEEYVSSEDESGDEGERKQYNSASAQVPLEDGPNNSSPRYLNPYRRAKLTHLLARIPESIALLRVGDVARVTNFVVNNAGQGAEEIVDMLLTNIEHPFRQIVTYNTTTQSNFGNEDSRRSDADAADPNTPNGRKDTSNAKLIGLYLVSDAIQASSTSGVRDAWKYRTLFEIALASRKIFSHLGHLEKDFAWGKMKSDQWKRKIGMILGLWEQWSVFPSEVHEGFKTSFAEPEMSAAEKAEREAEEAREKERERQARWRSAEEASKERNEAEERKKDEAKEKIRVLKEKAAAMAKERAEKAVDGQSQAQGSGVENAGGDSRPRRSRPTAADLFDAPPEETKATPEVPAIASPPVKIGGGFGFSMSLGSASSAPPKKPESAPAPAEAGTGDGKEDEDMFS